MGERAAHKSAAKMVPKLLLLLGGCLLFFPVMVDAHGAVTIPPPRQAADGKLAPWSGAVPTGDKDFLPWCPFPSASAAGKDPYNLTGSNGQACYWVSVQQNAPSSFY